MTAPTVFHPEPCAHCDARERALDTFVDNPTSTTAGAAIDLGPCPTHDPSPTWGNDWLHPSERKHAPRIERN